MNGLGSVLSTALTDLFFGETVMLVCSSFATQVSALTCLLVQSFGWVARCSGSDIQIERVSARAVLRPVPLASSHRLNQVL